MKALSIKDLSFGYGEHVVLKNISLEVEQGSYVSLIGHNGSGKTTLAKLIVGLLPYEQGEITISDVLLSKENLTTIRNKVAIVFQNPDNQFIGITVEDDIAFSLENRNVPRDEMQKLVKEYAEKVGMSEYLSKEPAYLSGGQKQRVAIADALVINPDILILDEATSMLDPKGKREILDLIKKMRVDNPELTIISITHDIEEALESDEVILLDKGEVVASGKPQDIFSNTKLVEEKHLEVPFVYKLKNEFKALGIDISDNDSLQDVGDKLCR